MKTVRWVAVVVGGEKRLPLFSVVFLPVGCGKVPGERKENAQDDTVLALASSAVVPAEVCCTSVRVWMGYIYYSFLLVGSMLEYHTHCYDDDDDNDDDDDSGMKRCVHLCAQ